MMPYLQALEKDMRTMADTSMKYGQDGLGAALKAGKDSWMKSLTAMGCENDLQCNDPVYFFGRIP